MGEASATTAVARDTSLATAPKSRAAAADPRGSLVLLAITATRKAISPVSAPSKTGNLHKRSKEVNALHAVKLAISPATAPMSRAAADARGSLTSLATTATRQVTFPAIATWKLLKVKSATNRGQSPATTATRLVTFPASAPRKVHKVKNATNRGQSLATSAIKKVTFPATALPSKARAEAMVIAVIASKEAVRASTAERKVTLPESAPAKPVASPP